MIASKTIQDNGDRTYNVSFGLLSRNEENDKIEGFRDLKWRKGVQNRNLREKLSKIGPVEKFWLRSTVAVNGSGHSQRSTFDDVIVLMSLGLTSWWWCALTWKTNLSMWGVWKNVGAWRRLLWRVLTGGGAWGMCSMCLTDKNSGWHMGACVSFDWAVFGWVLIMTILSFDWAVFGWVLIMTI